MKQCENCGKMAVNLQNGAQNWWSVDVNTAPFQCRWDYWTAPSDGQIPGEESQTQPECCFQLRPTPSSNWCHCNMDSIQARKYHLLRGQKHVRKCLRRCVCVCVWTVPTQISTDDDCQFKCHSLVRSVLNIFTKTCSVFLREVGECTSLDNTHIALASMAGVVCTQTLPLGGYQIF